MTPVDSARYPTRMMTKSIPDAATCCQSIVPCHFATSIPSVTPLVSYSFLRALISTAAPLLSPSVVSSACGSSTSSICATSAATGFSITMTGVSSATGSTAVSMTASGSAAAAGSSSASFFPQPVRPAINNKTITGKRSFLFFVSFFNPIPNILLLPF